VPSRSEGGVLAADPVASELRAWTLEFAEITAGSERSGMAPAVLADRVELARLGFVPIGACEARMPHAGCIAMRAEVMTSSGRDAFADTSALRGSNACETALATILDDGSVVATETRRDFWLHFKYGIAIRAARCVGHDLEFVPRGASIARLSERHRQRVEFAIARSGAQPIAHASIDQYLALRRALSVQRAERRAFQNDVGFWTLVAALILAFVLAVGAGVAAVVIDSTFAPALLLGNGLLVTAYVARAPVRAFGEHWLGPLLFRWLRPRQQLALGQRLALGPYR
jgi:hypothetical protein